VDGAPWTAVEWARGEARYAQIPDDVLQVAARERAETWATLQELAGVRSPFVDAIRTALLAEVQGKVAAEREAERRAHAAELADIEARLLGEHVVRLREGLLHLAGYSGERS
jgi:aminoglycoside phosphotransferase (APT) family kinase protein